MIAAVVILQLSLWVASTRAFFIWDACKADNKCSAEDSDLKTRTRRGFGNAPEDEPSEGLTLEMFERSPLVCFASAGSPTNPFPERRCIANKCTGHSLTRTTSFAGLLPTLRKVRTASRAYQGQPLGEEEERIYHAGTC